MNRIHQLAHLLAPVALLGSAIAMANPAMADGPVAGAVVGVGTSGALTPPVAALRANGMPSSGIHAGGYVPDTASSFAPAVAPAVAGLPSAVDLSQYSPPVGDQGGVDSCTSWAIGYYLRGWYANRDGYYPAGSYAPMYPYSQIVHGQNMGTTFTANFTILQQQGIDTRTDYTQGDYDYSDQPTPAESANALHIKIASFKEVDGANLQSYIESTLAAGTPLVVAFPIYPETDHASASNPLIGLPQPGEQSRGGHVTFAVKYDANGLWIENSWGTGWGLNGWGELSWAFVNQYVGAVGTMVPLNPGGVIPNVIGQLTAVAGSKVRAAGFTDTLTTVVDYTCNYVGRIKAQFPETGWAVYGTTVSLVQGTRPHTPCP